jgi:hypothetical protein
MPNKKNDHLINHLKERITEEQISIAEKKFTEAVMEKIGKTKGKNYSFFTKVKYDSIINDILYFKRNPKEKSPLYKRGKELDKKFVVFDVLGQSKLAIKGKDEMLMDEIDFESLDEVGLLENAFHNIYRIHDANSHVGVRNTWERTKEKYGQSYPLWMTQILIQNCPVCIRHQHHPTPKAGHSPIQTSGFLSRVQIDLIDMSTFADGNFKYILSLKDLGTKFVDLMALSSKSPKAVAFRLVELFAIIGVPSIIQADNGSEFKDIAYEDKNGSDVNTMLDDMVSIFLIVLSLVQIIITNSCSYHEVFITSCSRNQKSMA